MTEPVPSPSHGDIRPRAALRRTPSGQCRASRLDERLLKLFAFLGPIGTLIPVPFTAPSFRLFYLMLIPGIIAFAMRGRLRRPTLRLALLLPFIAYLAGSALYAATSDVGFGDPEESGNALVRFGLFVCLLVFSVLAAEVIRRWSLASRLSWLGTFFKAYFLSLVAGYVLILGFQFGLWDETFIQRFQILVQRGFGILRMSPGSYPNEYGTLSSFVLSALVLLEVQRKRWQSSFAFLRFPARPALWRATRFVLVLIGLFLTTTRAAYVSFILSAVYVALTQSGFGRKFKFVVAITAFFAVVLAVAQTYFDAVSFFVVGYEALFDESSSANERVIAWNTAFELFRTRELFGTGFGSVPMIHNVYLQFVFELGFVGCFILIACAGLLALTMRRPQHISALETNALVSPSGWRLLGHIRNIGIIHVVWFAASNHSLNHFLTWFVVLLVSLAARPVVGPPARLAPAFARVDRLAR